YCRYRSGTVRFSLTGSPDRPAAGQGLCRRRGARYVFCGRFAWSDGFLTMPVDRQAFRRVLGTFAAGVTVVTTIGDDHKPYGLTATAFTSVSLEPPLVLRSEERRVGKECGSVWGLGCW